MLLRIFDTRNQAKGKEAVNHGTQADQPCLPLIGSSVWTKPITATDPTPNTKKHRARGKLRAIGDHQRGHHGVGNGIPHQGPTLEGP